VSVGGRVGNSLVEEFRTVKLIGLVGINTQSPTAASTRINPIGRRKRGVLWRLVKMRRLERDIPKFYFVSTLGVFQLKMSD